ncbi:hypothetical protein FJ970_18020 [Mesorhizobium sp. B2-1-8]|uniref:hypothetical protein n=1 Tax=Mesorhizobium sp. B2-1-8 TaxID=2589967 RepID=UPI0011293029|nr:hypothetical protein [Mesorhizobium sp. B2-1-8]UCI17030.1 hypothetical protein FJ970_18020 [Mesorhizobium sp. B2-1-8]
MAFIAPLVGAAVGGGLLGSIATTAVGIGINLAIAYFFPQKITGPRAESLKAQTSRYGEQLTRWHGAIRTAGAVIWLKGDHVDEHVKKYRQGKALGPEVTEYSYTATFAVAFAWNGPASGVIRIWADDKLIFDVSAEALQDAIDHGSTAIGVAKGAIIRVYLGTDTQKPDPDIEADRGAGMVPAWPGIVYVVIKNLPLDEFGIRVPNIEGEITQSAIDSYISKALSPAVVIGAQCPVDVRGKYAVAVNSIWDIPSGTHRTFAWAGSNRSVLIDGRNNIIKSDGSGFSIFDAATGAFLQALARPVTYSDLVYAGSPSDDVSINGTTYVLEYLQAGAKVFTLLSCGLSGTLYEIVWTAVTAYTPDVSYGISVGPQYGYMVASSHTAIIRVETEAAGLVDTSITPAGLTAAIAGCYYDDDSDSVIIVTVNGDVFIYTPDLSTLLRSSTGHSLTVLPSSSFNRRMKCAPDQILVHSGTPNTGGGATWWIYRISDLQLLDSFQPNAVGYVNNGYYSESGLALGPDLGVAFGVSSVSSVSFFFLKRAGRQPVAVRDVLEEECTLAGLSCAASQITSEIMEAA